VSYFALLLDLSYRFSSIDDEFSVLLTVSYREEGINSNVERFARGGKDRLGVCKMLGAAGTIQM